MNFSLYFFSLVTATLSTAADNSSQTVPNPKCSAEKPLYSLQTLIMKQYCEKFPSIYVSWGKELAVAFGLGLALGKQSKIAKLGTTKTEETTLFVSQKELGVFISDNASWELDNGASYNPFDILFDSKCVQNIPKPKPMETLKFRSEYAKCALNPEAMIAVDTAILQWLAQAIHLRPRDVLQIDKVVLQFVCALSMHPFIGKLLMDDIQCVVEQICRYCTEESFSHILTIIKFLDDKSPIRLELEVIAAKMYASARNSCPESRMLLGPSHPLVLSMEKNASEEEFVLCDAKMQSQLVFGRKLYSQCGHDSAYGFELHQLFMSILHPTYLLKANIVVDGIEWKEKIPIVADVIYFYNRPSEDPMHNLFIISTLSLPPDFCEEVTSFTSLKKFHKYMEGPSIRRMILTYGITILESSSLFNSV